MWEETKYNMWGSVDNRNKFLGMAVDFTGNHILYGEWMKKVVADWRYSCEHNLSNIKSNRRAWIGHAACAYYMQCPEDIVRAAWSMLTDEQRNLANEEADKAIEMWENKYAEA